MNTDKKLIALVFICVLIMLGASLFISMPRIKDHYLTSSQDSITAELAGRLELYLTLAGSELEGLSNQSFLKNRESNIIPDLSALKKNSKVYFNDYFLFNAEGDLIRATGNSRVQSLKLHVPGKGPDEKGGSPFPLFLDDTTGRKIPAILTPVTNTNGSLSGWLAGTINPNAIYHQSIAKLSEGEEIYLYLCENDGNAASLSSEDLKSDTGHFSTLISKPGKSPTKQLETGEAFLVAAEISETGWSLVSLRPKNSGYLNFRGGFLKASLILFITAVALIVISYYLIIAIMKPLFSFVEMLKQRFETDSKDILEGLSSRIETLCSSINIAESVPIGIMVVDLEGRILFFNREAGEITGQEPSSVVGKPMLHYFPNNYYNYTMESIGTGREYLGLRNIIKVDTFFRELLLNISPIYTGESITGAVATFQDVTPQRKMIEVHAAYTLARDLASQKDLDSTVRVIARAAAEMVDIEYTAIFLVDRDGHLLISSYHGIPSQYVDKYNSMPYKVDSPEIRDLYRNRTPLIHGEVRNKINLKPVLIVPGIISFYSFPIIYEDKLIGLVNLYSGEKNKLSRDKIYLIQTLSGQVNTAVINFYEFQKMKVLASVDGLTGLLNKQYFLESVNIDMANSSSGSPLSLAILDLDNFKKVNDTYGHQAGDHVLKEAANILSNSLRDKDSICRFGGEEIAISLPGTAKDEAIELIDSIRIKIQNTPVYHTAEGSLYITVSGGISTYPGDGRNVDELILSSDTALYTAKRNGRNMVIGYRPEQKLSS
ncbi:MAG: diguanylate cyclase [Bacillota bacterium]